MSKFITLEGGEGVGKSTALSSIQSFLDKLGVEFVVTREPGGTPIAEAIRRTLLADHAEPMHAKTELLLMFASRYQHVEQVIKPALAEGKMVICDRYMDASYAYQGGGRELGYDCVASLESWLALDVQVDATLLLDAPVDVGFQRIESSRDGKDRIEQEKIDFFHRVRSAYLNKAASEPTRFHVIDANQSMDDVQQDIQKALQRILSAPEVLR